MKIERVFLLLATVALLFSAEALPVQERDALYVAKGWSILNAHAFGALGDVEGVTAEKNSAGQIQWYVVKMTKGVAIVAPDDEIEPVIAVLPNSDGVIPEGCPLRAMLERDLANRLARVGGGTGGKLKLSTSSANGSEEVKETTKWNRLRKYGRGLVLTTSSGGKSPATIVRWLDGWNSDSTVGSVQTLRFWNQDFSEEYFSNSSIFDLYTPGNSPCGCVATAGSAVMHYFHVPSGNELKRTCSYNGKELELTTKGGDYDWSLIDGVKLERNEPITLSSDAVDLLGKVAHDCGVGCNMDYGDRGSGSFTVNLMNSFRDVFNVQNAQLVTKDGSEYGGGEETDIGSKNYPNVIYNQIRGGAPVVLGIDGHEVVACGYGYDDDLTDYTYVFIGWGGYNDAWYALPIIDTKATPEGGTYTSKFVDELITEIAPFDDKFVAVVGRVVDADGEPVPDDAVIMSNGEVVWTDKNGFFGTRVSPDDPCYVIDSFGEEHPYELGDAAKKTTTMGVASGALAAAMPDAMVVERLEPTVRVGGDDTRIFGSLTKALENVRAGETVEILEPTVFKKSVVITNDCTIFSTNSVAAAALVRHKKGAVMSIANGVTVTISNVCFETEITDTMVDVMAGGKLSLGSGSRIGAIRTAEVDGLTVVDALTDSLYISCAGADGEGDVFAKYTTDYETATNVAHFLRHPTNTRLGGEADSDGNIFWSRNAPVGDDIASARTRIGGEIKNYLSLDDIIEDVLAVTDPIEIVVLKNGTITNGYPVQSASVTIRGEGVARSEVTMGMAAGFTVPANTALAFSNIVFVGSAPVNEVSEMIFIRVNGGELTLGDGAEICGFTGRVDGKSGVIDLLDGTATMKNGAVIRDCVARGLSRGRGQGGAIYVAPKATCTLNLEGGTITNCWAATYGGGVYAYLSATADYSPFVNVSGELTIAGNRSANSAKDDLYLGSDKTMAQFRVVDEVDGRIGITYPGFGSGNAEGDAFIANGLSDGVSERTLYSFFNDTLDGMIAAEGAGAQAGMLVWVKDPRDPRQCEKDEAAARLIAGSTTNYWREVSDALSVATNNCIVEVMAHGTDPVSLSDSVVLVGTNITLCSDSDVAPAIELMRGQDVRIVVPVDSELVVTNLDICGYDPLSAEWATNTVTLFDVNGGELTLDNVGIRYLVGDGKRNANAITVYNGGTLWMKGFSRIDTCSNVSPDPTDVKLTDAGAGGAILVDHATAHLVDTTIDGCEAWKGGGVFVCNGSTLHLSGETQITNNFVVGKLDACNIEFSEDSSLVLEGALSNRVGVTSLDNSVVYPGDTNRVAAVGYTWESDFTSLTNSAASFRRDGDGDVGVAVTNKTDELTTALIVWSTALKDGQYVDLRNGKIYLLAGEMPAPLEKANPEQPVAPKATAITILNVKPVDGGLAITVLATEGGNAVAVTPEQVTGLFEATTDLGDWTTKKVSLTVESSDQNADGTTTFTVKPAGNPNTAFIRLVQ